MSAPAAAALSMITRNESYQPLSPSEADGKASARRLPRCCEKPRGLLSGTQQRILRHPAESTRVASAFFEQRNASSIFTADIRYSPHYRQTDLTTLSRHLHDLIPRQVAAKIPHLGAAGSAFPPGGDPPPCRPIARKQETAASLTRPQHGDYQRW